MDASWVARKQAEEEVRRQKALAGLAKFADGEQRIMLQQPDDDEPRDRSKPWDDPEELRRTRLRLARSSLFRHRWDKMEDLRAIANRMLDGTATEDDECRMYGILVGLEAEIRADEYFASEDDPSPCEATDGTLMRDRLAAACGEGDAYRLQSLMCQSSYGFDYDRYLDETLALPRGNYVITDPCYLMTRDEDYSDLENVLSTFKMRDTLYGDWSCTLFKVDGTGHGEPAGQFCADAGLVCVADWDEVIAHNPEVASWPEERPWTMTVIRDFEGTATFQVTEDWYLWQRRKPNHVEYELEHDYELRVILEGTQGATGEHVRYDGRQTGF